MRRVMLLFLSRFAQASTAALVALVLAGAARADTIKEFVLSGTAFNISEGMLGSCQRFAHCAFSGTMTVDVTNGTLETIHITFPGLSTFDTIDLSEHYFGSTWSFRAQQGSDSLRLIFSTAHLPASLVGFDGGSIIGSSTVSGSHGTLYVSVTGSITPVPEPSSLVLLLGSGLLGLAEMTRRKLQLGT
jgi:hypothetical protein